MCFPSRLIKCCVLLQTSALLSLWNWWACCRRRDSPPNWSQVLTLLQGHGAVSFHAGFCDEMCSYGWHVCVNSGVHLHFQPVSDYRLLTFAICCFDFFFFRRHSALPTAKCSFRQTSREKHEKLRTVTDSCHWCCTSDFFLQNLMSLASSSPAI